MATRRFKRADGSTLLELRGEGAQTVFPPSVHEDGLAYEWVRDCDPCEVEAARLQRLAATIATVAYASEFWTQGSRHDLALALAGFLARRLAEDDLLVVMRAVATVAADADFRDREEAVRTTVRRLKNGEEISGLPTLEAVSPDLARALASWWRTALPDAAKRGQRPESQADALVEIGLGTELFHDPAGAAFARLRVAGHAETWSLASKRFRSWLRREHHWRYGKAPNSEAVNSACGVLDGVACFDRPQHELHNRVAWHDGAIYYDLTDAKWRAVRIDASGWSIVDAPPILFRRYQHQMAQVEPRDGGDPAAVLEFLNVRPDDRLLLLCWLVSAYVPEIPHPIPDFHGEKGSGKSAGQRVLRRLIDPSSVESLSFPADVRELVQQLSHHYAPLYDNVDGLSNWVSDILCRAITGEGFSKRELYSDDEDVIYSYRRVVMLNGVNVVPQRPDLLDRSILIALDRIPRTQRREERALWREFEELRPAILGGIFDTLSRALAIYPDLQLPALERMADFTLWGAAISQALGYGANAFLDAYGGNLQVQTREAVRGHAVGAAILALIESAGEWAGTPSDLLAALEEAGEDAKLFRRAANGKVQAKGWPGAPHILTRRLNEVRSNLVDLGIEIVAGRADDRAVTIRRVPPEGTENAVGGVGSVGQIRPGALSPDATTDAAASEALSSVGTRAFSQIRPDGTDAADASLPALKGPATPSLPAELCPCCRADAWWQRADGQWVCGVCHPDPTHPVAGHVLFSADGRRSR